MLTSHGHDDHNAAGAAGRLASTSSSPFTVTRVLSAHDVKGGSLRGPNTIHVLEAGGLRVAHLGDLGHLPDAAQQSAVSPAAGVPAESLYGVDPSNSRRRLDALMVPIGGYYTIGAAEAKAVIRQLSPTVVLPMHYRSQAFGFDVIGTLVVRYPGDTLVLTKDTPRQTAVLQYQ